MKPSDHPLRRWRQANNVTLKALKERAGVKVSPSHISEIERHNNTPSLDLAAKLSRATDGEVSIADFVGGDR
jgi:transcriptional regulator with XRE-family HTH domain